METDRGLVRRSRLPLSVIALAAVAVTAVVLARGTVIALIGAIGLVVGTGVAAVLVAFPLERSEGPTALERAALSVALGSVLASLVALALAAAGRLGPATFGGLLVGIVVAGAGVAIRRRTAPAPSDGPNTGTVPSDDSDRSRTDTSSAGAIAGVEAALRGMVGALGRWPAIGLALLGGVAIAWLLALGLGAGAAPLTEFSLRTVTDAGVVADAPNALAPGEEATVSLAVGNHAPGERSFTVVVLLQNATRSEPTSVAAEEELDRFRLSVPPDAVQRTRYTLAPPRGEHRVVYLLFEGPAPPDPSADGLEPVARLHHWLSVGENASAGNATLAIDATGAAPSPGSDDPTSASLTRRLASPGPPPRSQPSLPDATFRMGLARSAAASPRATSETSVRRVTSHDTAGQGSDGG